MPNTPDVTIVPADPTHVAAIHTMLESLADHLGLAHELVATEADLQDALFGDRPRAEALVAFVNHEPAGFALYYYNYSSFRGRCGLHLEDLYVRPQARGNGIGRALLAELARITEARGCGRLEWWVLNEDERAIAFYENLGASAKGEWTIFRLRGEALAALAQEAS